MLGHLNYVDIDVLIYNIFPTMFINVFIINIDVLMAPNYISCGTYINACV